MVFLSLKIREVVITIVLIKIKLKSKDGTKRMRDSFAKTLTKNVIKNKNIVLMIGDTGSDFLIIQKENPNNL